jgi:hypothetical protein
MPLAKFFGVAPIQLCKAPNGPESWLAFRAFLAIHVEQVEEPALMRIISSFTDLNRDTVHSSPEQSTHFRSNPNMGITIVLGTPVDNPLEARSLLIEQLLLIC